MILSPLFALRCWSMGSKVHLEPQFYLVAAAAVLLIPLRWLGAWTVAVLMHELFHILALEIMGCAIHRITVGPNGAVIRTQDMTLLQEFVCATAGPVGSFSLLLLARWLPLVAMCGFVQGCYNLLPLNTMDGGRIVSCFLRLLGKGSDLYKAQNIIEWCVVTTLIVLGLYCLVILGLGTLPLIFVLFLAARSGKIPCKTSNLRVQ